MAEVRWLILQERTAEPECHSEDFIYSERQEEATEQLERAHLDMIKFVFMADISGCSVEHE